MPLVRRFFRFSLGLIGVGYLIGLLSAPRSGAQTRAKIKAAATTSSKDIDKELKRVYTQTKEALQKALKENPKVSENLKQLKVQAGKSQSKVKDLLSALHGQDNIDEDLSLALNDAKKVLSELKNYLAK